ncbi:unnamed protein product [Rotaria sordida]|uniref:Tc1-like transposase DDE domain-containing protein n=1 Tax=Rotaria sordida TaxID=392033 RepID=A0A819TXL2_9BILA|nr:unnamed protein product [Rotaria sordida]
MLFQETNDVMERTGRGRLHMLNNDEIHTLQQILYRYPTVTSSSIADRLLQRISLRINPRTIRNYRLSLGFRAVHARTRLNNVIFSDEKAFEVDISGVVYWIPYGRPRPTQYQHQVQFRVTVFGAIWYDERSNLIFIGDRTNTTTYIQHLQAAFHLRLRQVFGYYFIHDRPTWAHTTLAHDWLRNNRISCMDNYPPVSPDLNAIESVWG